MQVTEEGYLLTRNILKVEKKENKILSFIRYHRLALTVSGIFLGLLLVEGILLNQFIHLLHML